MGFPRSNSVDSTLPFGAMVTLSRTVPPMLGNFWDDNSLSWTSNLDASQGINLNHDLLDSTSAPAEFLPYLPWERQFNYEHDNNHCTVQPCGAQFAMWDGPSSTIQLAIAFSSIISNCFEA